MNDKRRWLWGVLILVWTVAMTIKAAIWAITDQNVFMRGLAILALVIAAFVAGMLVARARLRGRKPEAAA
ncbi:hypothetical protein ABZO31_17485 [Streptomyces sp. HUAS MG47]|uniref:hypothetical protein n=1 Tax=Streptomyces solicamelliae TaxID=3231716 RepID=UPI003877D93B